MNLTRSPGSLGRQPALNCSPRRGFIPSRTKIVFDSFQGNVRLLTLTITAFEMRETEKSVGEKILHLFRAITGTSCC